MSVTIAEANASLLSFIERASRDPEFDITKFESLLRMQEKLVNDQARREFNAAMSAAQNEMQPVLRNAVNEHTKTRYAKLETIDSQMRPIYARHGFSVRYGSAQSSRDGWLRITCTIAHVGGYSEEHYLDSPPDSVGAQGRSNKTAVQAVGAAITYLRRYLLCMAFNIVLSDDPDDDDGAALGVAPRRPPPPMNGGAAAKPPDPFPDLEENHGPTWMAHLKRYLDEAPSLAVKMAITDDPRVQRTLRNAPKEVQTNIRNLLVVAHKRLTDLEEAKQRQPQQPQGGEPSWQDEAAELIAEVQEMDLETLDGLRSNKAWLVKTRDLFPLDQDRLQEAETERRAYLQKQGSSETTK